jgi:uncharacterized protein YggE
MKKYFVLIGTFCILVLHLRAYSAPKPPVGSQMMMRHPQSIINVQGVGNISVKPNIAFVELGVETENKDPLKAQQENTTKINAINQVLKGVVVDKDQQTQEYAIIPSYSYEKSKPILEGYKVRHILKLKISQIDKVGEIIQKATQAGANVLNNVRFDIENKDNVIIKAAQKALKNAQEKAKAMASTMGLEIDRVLNISDTSFQAPVPPMPLMGRNLTFSKMNEAPSLAQGSLNIHVVVFVSFITKKG